MKDKKVQDYLDCCIINKCGEPGCDNYEVRKDLIQKIIDGQANEDELSLYNAISSKCSDCKCRQYCEQELAIKNLLQTKLDRKRVPLDIIEKIKTRINKTT
ncbi:MAG: hypothetical protein KAR17_04030 [Cyclobacteriaceae bacterium]|nr:hypothetical protein [Cyclobacteriaceae bacterium]